MSDLYWLTNKRMERRQPFFPERRGRPRVDDRRGPSGIVFVNRNGLRWCDVPKDCCPYNRWKRWGESDIFLHMTEGLAAANGDLIIAMINATYLKAHRTASGLRVEKGASAS